jgi:hypothetical protein
MPKIYPVQGDSGPNFVQGVPAVEQDVPTKKEADELVKSGAFTDNPRAPERDKEAPAAPEK